jgi:hypothetical protein
MLAKLIIISVAALMSWALTQNALAVAFITTAVGIAVGSAKDN